MMDNKLVNQLIWLIIFSSLLYLVYMLVNYCITDIQQYFIIKESKHLTKARYMLNVYFALFASISTLWALIVMLLFLFKKKYFKQNLISLYLIFSCFLAMTFLISEYFIHEYSFYFYYTRINRLVLFLTYSVIYTGIAFIVSRSKYVASRFTF
jgi:hypothetical protein